MLGLRVKIYDIVFSSLSGTGCLSPLCCACELCVGVHSLCVRECGIGNSTPHYFKRIFKNFDTCNNVKNIVNYLKITF